MLAILFVIVFLAVVLTVKAVKVIPDNQRVAIERLGRFQRIAGPGLIFVVPSFDRIAARYSVDDSEVHFHDDRLGAEAVVKYRVLDPQKAHQSIGDVEHTVRESVRTAIGKSAESRSGGGLTDTFGRQAIVSSANEIVQGLGLRISDLTLG